MGKKFSMTLHARQRIHERYDGNFLEIQKKMERGNYLWLTPLTNNRKHSFMLVQNKPAFVIWTKSTHEIISVLPEEHFSTLSRTDQKRVQAYTSEARGIHEDTTDLVGDALRILNNKHRH